MSWAYKKGTADFNKHDERSVWSLTLNSSGKIEDGGLDKSELLRSDRIE